MPQVTVLVSLQLFVVRMYCSPHGDALELSAWQQKNVIEQQPGTWRFSLMLVQPVL